MRKPRPHLDIPKMLRIFPLLLMFRFAGAVDHAFVLEHASGEMGACLMQVAVDGPPSPTASKPTPTHTDKNPAHTTTGTVPPSTAFSLASTEHQRGTEKEIVTTPIEMKSLEPTTPPNELRTGSPTSGYAPTGTRNDSPHTVHCGKCHPYGSVGCSLIEGKGAQCHCREEWPRGMAGNGRCVNRIDHGLCECRDGFSGDDCQVYKTAVSWNDPDTIRFFSPSLISTAVMGAFSIGIFIFKLATKLSVLSERDDPQHLFQEARSLMLSVGNIAILIYKEPNLVNLDPLSSRCYFLMVNFAYTASEMFWLQEGLSVRSVCLVRNRNEWNIDFEGRKRWQYGYLARVSLPYTFSISSVLGVLIYGWDLVPATWTPFGRFRSNDRPHFKVMTHHFLDMTNPFTKERVDKVYRNLPFVIIGPLLHFLTWFFLAVSSDTNIPVLETIATALAYIYTANNILQWALTSPEIFSHLTCAMMRWAPVSYRPSAEKLPLRTIDEVLNKNDPDWIVKTQQKKNREIKDQDMRETREWNDRDFPNAPAWLLRQPKDEGPASILPPPPKISPNHKEYISRKRQQRILKRWNREYLEERLESRQKPAICAWVVLKREMDLGMLDGTEKENSQMRSIWATFYLHIPCTDNLDLTMRLHRDAVREALYTYAYDNYSCEEVKTLPQIHLDVFGRPYQELFMKMPYPKTDYQIDVWDAKYGRHMRDLNDGFDASYADDDFAILLMDGLDDERRQEWRECCFIGPARFATAPLVPDHREIAIKQREYGKMQEELWHFMRLNAMSIAETRQLRETYWGLLRK